MPYDWRIHKIPKAAGQSARQLTDLLTRPVGTGDDVRHPATPTEAFAWSVRLAGMPETGKTCVVVLITQRQQAHNRDMTRQRRHPARRSLAALQWILDHLPKRQKRPPTAGVREPRRPKPTLPAAAVALKEPRVGLMHRIKLGSRRPGDQT